MSALDEFRDNFDSEGRFLARNGSLDVVFATKGGGRFSGKLHFVNGLCISAEMAAGGGWANPDDSPIHGIRFLLELGDEILHGVAIDQGRLISIDEPKRSTSKRDFLLNFRVARNLFVHSHQVEAVNATIDATAISSTLARAAIWLTPKSVAGFDAADFTELGRERQAELLAAVQSFETVARQVPSDKPPTLEQYGNAIVAFVKIMAILEPYLPVHDESRQVESALRDVEFPSWVVNWDYELADDSEGVAAAWVNVFADEQAVPKGQLGRAASELTSKVRQAFDAKEILRWPYIRMKTALEHKAG